MTMTKTLSLNISLILSLSLFASTFIERPRSAQGNIQSSTLTDNRLIWASHFDFPVGKPDSEGYYNAQEFGKNNHLGDDWNGNGGGDSDFGDTIYSVANGYIQSAENYGSGWGKVIIIEHYLDESNSVTSLYAHCDKMLVTKKRQLVKRGNPIGTIGNAEGIYPAHLHFEMRHNIDLPIGSGYSTDTSGYIDPTAFINHHR